MSSSQPSGPGLELVRAESQHVGEMGRICYEAFKALYERHHLPLDCAGEGPETWSTRTESSKTSTIQSRAPSQARPWQPTPGAGLVLTTLKLR